MLLPPPTLTLFPYTTLFRSRLGSRVGPAQGGCHCVHLPRCDPCCPARDPDDPHRDGGPTGSGCGRVCRQPGASGRSEEHTSELQSQFHLVCRLLLEKKKNKE